MASPSPEIVRSEAPLHRPPRRFRGLRGARPALKLIGVVLVTCIVAGSAGLWIGSRVRSPDQVAAEAEPPPPSLITAEVTERVLAERFSVVGYVTAGSITERPVLAGEGSSVVTRLPATAGETVEAGSLLAEVAGRPVFAVAGEMPVFRTIRPGDSGDDVDQLQATLARAGFLQATTAAFGAEAQAAVRALYASAGYEPASVDGGVDDAVQAVESAEDAVDAADRSLAASRAAAARAVTAAETEVDSAKTGLATAKTNGALALSEAQARAADAKEALQDLRADENAAPAEIRAAETALLEADNAVIRVTAQNASAAEAASGRVRIAEQALRDARSSSATAGESAALAAAKEALDDARTSLAAVRAQSGVVVPGSEIVAVWPLPATLIAVGLRVGDPLEGGPAFTFSSGSPVVEAWVSPAQRSVMSVGDSAVLTVEGAEISGEVASIDAEMTASPRGLDGHRVEIVTTTVLPVSALGSETTTIIESRLTDGSVPAVPVSAVQVDSDGNPTVAEVAADGSQIVHPVRLGASAAGFVELLPAEHDGPLPADGATVVVSSP